MQSQRFRLCIAEIKVKSVCVVAGRDVKSPFCCKSCGRRKWKLETVSCSGKMQMSYIGMFDLLTPAVPGEFPWPILCTGCCVRPHVPLLQSRQAQYATYPSLSLPLPWKDWPLNSQASGNICSPEIHTSCQLGSGWARGLGKDPLMQLWPGERPDQEVLRLEEGGGCLGGGLFSGGGPIVP